MKKLLLILLIFIGVGRAFAQIEVESDSFKEVPGFVNLDIDRMYDDNGEPYAVLKIRTQNINNKQRRAFRFSVDRNVSYEIVYQTGEIWLFISYYVKHLTISSPDFNTINYTIPIDMKPKGGYEVTIVNNAEVVEMGFAFVDIVTKPLKGATIFIDGQRMSKKTPYSIEVTPGKHEITVAKDLFEMVTRTVELKADEDLTLDITMPLSTGAQITLKADNETSVYLDGEFKAKGNWSDYVKAGQHTIEYKKPDHYDSSKTVTLAAKESQTYELHPTPIIKETPQKETPKEEKTSRNSGGGSTGGGGGSSWDWEPREGYETWSLTVDYAFDRNGTQSLGLTWDRVFDDGEAGMFITMYGNMFAKGKYPKLTCDKNYLIDGYYPSYKDDFQAHNITFLMGFSFLNNIAWS